RRERDEALDLMIAVRTPPEHPQREIDLGGRVLDARKRHGRRGGGASAAPVLLAGRSRGILGKPGLELLLDLVELVLLGVEVARMRPLEARLEDAADPPIGVAEMIVDGRIFRLELDRAIELLGG